MTGQLSNATESPAVLLSGQLGTKLHGIWALLERAKLRVVVAESREYAELACRERPFAVVVYALTGNTPSHIEAARFIREAKNNVATPVLLVAPSGLDLALAMKSLGGMVDCVEEPLDDLILQNKVKLFVELDGARARLRELASRTENDLHDGLTGLPTRALLMDRIGQGVRIAARGNGRVAIGVMDLEQLQDVRETLGPVSHDELLRQVALRLTGSLRRSDTVARVGTERFATVLACETLDGVETVTERLERVLSEPFLIGDHRISIGGGIGVAMFPDHGREPQALLDRANAAMVVAKQQSLGHLIYDPVEHAEEEHALTAVFESTELRVAYGS
jgi:diguanylate cyclase (GGDEF)-like protein